jgi:hypothetical protein
MDLIFTNKDGADQGILFTYALDLSFGAEENDFELILSAEEASLDFGAVVYVEGTEYGGTVDGRKSTTGADTVTYLGRTWHGIMNGKVIEPDPGEDHLVVSGDANAMLAFLVARLGLSELFVADETSSGMNISNYQFARYCRAYDGIRAMLNSAGAKLRIAWVGRKIRLSAVPIVDYTRAPVDGDMAVLTVEQYRQKVNHMVCLGKGELSERDVIHLYVDQFGRVGDTQYYTGLDEITDIYENTNAESHDALRTDGVAKLTAAWNADKAEISISESADVVYDIGDIVGASDIMSGVSVAETVTQKIVKISGGVASIEYKTGR